MKSIKPFILLLIGPGGAGKTTAAELLAKRFKRSAVIEVDEIFIGGKYGKAGRARF